MTSKWLALTTILAIAIATTAANGREDQDDDRDDRAYAIGLWGDLPYSDVQVGGVANLVKDMNAQPLAFTVHDGDLKQGNGLPICDDAMYARALETFNSLRAPAMFTPGDNDWTDCDRPNNGRFNSLERLSYERRVFFDDNFSLGHRRLRQDVQTEPTCLGSSATDYTSKDSYPEACRENRRWTMGSVTYATLNIQGSCNNLCGDQFNESEYKARNAANIRWMQDTFDEAARRHSVAIMLISQADPGFSLFEFDAPNRNPATLAQTTVPPNPHAVNFDGFQEFLVALRAEVIAFGKPVDYVHGDSHYFRVDKPLLNSAGSARLENFTRVETFGNHAEGGTNDVQWVKVLVLPGTREVFAYQPQIIPENQAAMMTP